MFRTASLAFALVASPALAAPHYQATPVAPAPEGKIVVRSLLWKCAAEDCSAGSKSNSRPAIVCAALAKEVGELRSFSVGGQPLSPEELQKCNARAG